ncbi:MAG: CotH kinase family protein [Lachnospiraceae bacterium]|nr:CotH kinase family protein [Lachnospiraceae bacterium]
MKMEKCHFRKGTVHYWICCCLLFALCFMFPGITAQAANSRTYAVNIEGDDRPTVGSKLHAQVVGDLINGTYTWSTAVDKNGKYTKVSDNIIYEVTADDCEKWLRITVSGVTTEGVPCTVKNTIYISQLPVVYINTDDVNAEITKEAYTDATMRIQGNEKFPQQFPVKSDKIQIKGRGNSSWGYKQKPYKLKLEKKTDLFGMGSNKHWVLLSNYYDVCAMRFQTANEIAKELNLINMDTQWVVVILNGDYAGMYQLAEQIRIGDTRIPITDWEDLAEEAANAIYKGNKKNLADTDQSLLKEQMTTDLSWITTDQVTYKNKTYKVSDWYADYSQKCEDISGGYLFELSEEYDEVSKFITNSGVKVMMNNPEYLCTNSKMMSYVQDYWKQFDEAAISLDGHARNGKSLYELADVDSMVSYWLVQEIIGNDDAHYKSRYAYKDKNGKLLFGPVWDVDWGCATIPVGCYPENWKVSHDILWKDWIDDPYFLAEAVDMYWKHHDAIVAIASEDGLLGEYNAYLRGAGSRSFDKWQYYRSYEYDFAIYKDYMQQRIKWLDAQFASVDTLTRSLFTISRNRYKKTSNIEIQVNKEQTTADQLVVDIHLTDYRPDYITYNTEFRKSFLDVTINGANRQVYTVINNHTIIIDKELLKTDGSANVIALWNNNAHGDLQYTNYAIIRYEDDQFVVTDTEGTIERHLRVPSVGTNAGSEEYWYDTVTGLKYSDYRLEHVVTDDSLIIPPEYTATPEPTSMVANTPQIVTATAIVPSPTNTVGIVTATAIVPSPTNTVGIVTATAIVPSPTNTTVVVTSTAIVPEPIVTPVRTSELVASPEATPVRTPELVASPEVTPVRTPELVASPEVTPVRTPELVASPEVTPVRTPELVASPEVTPVRTPELVASPEVTPARTPELVASPEVTPVRTPELVASPEVTPVRTPELVASPEVTPVNTPEVVTSTAVVPVPTEAVPSVNVIQHEDGSKIMEETIQNGKSTTKVQTYIAANGAIQKIVYTVQNGKKKTSIVFGVSGKKLKIKKVVTNETTLALPEMLVANGVKYKVVQVNEKAIAKQKTVKKLIIGKYITKLEKKALYKNASLNSIVFKNASITLKKDFLVGNKEIKSIQIKGDKASFSKLKSNLMKFLNLKKEVQFTRV